jgi:hypothetical protein
VPRMPNSTLAYVAGLIDGEGCIGAYHQHGRLVLGRMQVTNTDKRMVDFLLSTIGKGHISVHYPPNSK